MSASRVKPSRETVALSSVAGEQPPSRPARPAKRPRRATVMSPSSYEGDVAHLLGQRQRGREAGRFDAEEVYKAGHAMIGRALHDEVLGRRTLRHGLGPDAGIARLQRAILEAGPVAAHGGIELVGAMGIDVVVDAVDPFDVRAELGLAAQVDGDVHAEPARHGDGIDQAREGRASGQGEIVSFGVVRLRHAVGWHAGDFFCQRRRMQTGAVDDQPATQVHWLGAAHPDLDAIALGAALDLGEAGAFGLVGGHDQLAAIAMRHAVLGAVGIEQAPAGDAGPRHQAALGIVDAGVDDFGIPRAGLGADAFGGLDDDDLTAGKGKSTGDGQTNDTCADHNAVDGFERGRSHGRMLVERTDYGSKTPSWLGARDSSRASSPDPEEDRATGVARPQPMNGALVTGSAVRVGRALAMALAADGYF